MQQAIESAAESAAQARERVDLSLPGIRRPLGTRHLIRQTFAEIERIFLAIGFKVVEGPEIETPYYNFEALNIPEHHPARDTMDTFYMETPPGSPLAPAAHAYLAHADSHHGEAGSAGAHHRARQGLSPR